ncbi:uncharacterized protein [Montipora foliosa]|uniref:uncharacterized protein isoform X2 n=1 Tax=Montipora foliosa TaxID=591990 RepID=UPI0035F19510
MAASQVEGDSQDISAFPALTFDDVVRYSKEKSGCTSTSKAYKFMAEPGYLHDIKVNYTAGTAKVNAKCFRYMKKSEPPHIMEVSAKISDASLAGKCSCVAGIGGYCHHVIGLLYYLALLKQLGHCCLPDELTCTSMKQRWSVPRGRKIEQKEIQDVLVKKPQMGAQYSKFIKSTLYSPATMYGTWTKNHFSHYTPQPLIATLVPSKEQMKNVPFVPCRYGNVPKGCVLSYQQRMSTDYVINDFTCTAFPELPLDNSDERFENNYSICLDNKQQAAFEALSVTREASLKVQEQTITQSSSSIWYLLRKKRITASKFGLVAKRVSNFGSLVGQLNPSRYVQTNAMKRGIELEAHAAMVYANSAKGERVNLFPSGLVINPKCAWLGCSPDRKVYDLDAVNSGKNPFGLLEVKVVKEGETTFDNVRYLVKDPVTSAYTLKTTDIYYYQVQCLLGLTGLEWCDFFSYINDNLYVCQRIMFDQFFFQEAKDKVDSFFFQYYLC